jgi:pyruvate dehydrogenase kinase 2/3/4
MVQFGQNPSQGTLLRASQFLLGTPCEALVPVLCWLLLPYYGREEELPVRLAHRAKELDELPHNLSSMGSIQKVKNWYAQSFEVRSHSHIPFLGHLRLILAISPRN